MYNHPTGFLKPVGFDWEAFFQFGVTPFFNAIE